MKMRVKITESKNAKNFYIIKSIRINGKNTSKIVEKLGTLDEVKIKAKGMDPYEWAKKRAKELTENEKKENHKIMIKLAPNKQIKTDEQRTYNGGYLFLQKIYHELGLNQICLEITNKYNFKYDFNDILSRLVYSRILFPASKKATFEISKKYFEQPKFQLHQIYRALEVLYKESDFIQAELYKNSLNIIKRNDKILYYDCTNFFFEIEQQHGMKQYGHSKENRPNPIVQMGLFMDGNGLPLAFSITPGNQNEQTTLKPLEQKIISDFKLSKLVICTDAGLSSTANRKFNNQNNRAFITTHSLKKSKKHIKEWALNTEGWRLPNQSKKYTIEEISEINNESLIFYKERWLNEDGLEQRIIVSYSLKYKNYQQKIRNRQIEKAIKQIQATKKPPQKLNANDYRRFINQKNITVEGEIANREIYSIDEQRISQETQYDGFYAVCTNLEDDIEAILKVNHGRWEIEESFRLMKSEFKARPVNLSRDERIYAHFTTCFISLMIYRVLEKKLQEKYTNYQLLDTIRGMNFLEVKGEGAIPLYNRTEITDQLHEVFEFRTDYQINSQKNIKKIIKQTKK